MCVVDWYGAQEQYQDSDGGQEFVGMVHILSVFG
jgi:hypothetical protein